MRANTQLLGYFYECALLGGNLPEDIQKYLPWNMTEKQKQLFSESPKHEDTGKIQERLYRGAAGSLVCGRIQ